MHGQNHIKFVFSKLRLCHKKKLGSFYSSFIDIVNPDSVFLLLQFSL